MKTTASSFSDLSDLWSCLDFGAPELRDYATPVITRETRKGVALLSLVALLFLLLAAIMCDFDRVVAHHHGQGVTCWFGLFDIDRFKSINDTFGHGSGDEVLRAVHAAFSDLPGDVEYLARLGGDEFALLMCGPDVPARVEAALASISRRMSAPLPGGVTPTVSLGLVRLAPGEVLSFDGAYKRADELLYEAKHAGGNAIRSGADARAAA